MSSFNGFKEVTEKLDAIDFNPYKKIGKEWFLVTAGDESGWNTMTASWVFCIRFEFRESKIGNILFSEGHKSFN